jgi:hypothetical protein
LEQAEQAEQVDLVAKIQAHLEGKALACRGGQGTPCHGDLLTKIAANGVDVESTG